MKTNICRISTYDDILKLIEYERPEYLNDEDPEVIDFLRHINDFEPVSFLVINDDSIVSYDRISGDVISQTEINEFIEQLIDYAKEEA